jgi:5-methylthioadenosine/S-adenosylhomocysteine deaminase
MKTSFSLGLHAGFCLPMTEQGLILKNIFIGICDDKIQSIEPFSPQHQNQCDTFLDLSHHIVLPGLINAHTHLAMNLFRGIEDNLNLQDWLFKKIFPLESQFVSKPFVKLGVELAAFECIRFGTTTVADMYFHPEEALSVWDSMGLRGFFGQPLISFPSPEAPDGNNQPLLDHFETLFQKYQNHSRLQVTLAPHAPYTCSPELLKQVQTLQKKWNCFVQIHLAETMAEQEDIQKRFQCSPTQHLHNLGLLGPKTLCAHVVHTSQQDRDILKQTQTSVVHNPDSNFKLGSGIAPVTDYIQNDINVCLGTDGAASNNDLSLFGALDLMAKAQKVYAQDISQFTTWMALWSATRSGALALGLENKIGQLHPGFQADLIAVDTLFPHMQPLSDPASHLVFSTQGLEVDTTIVEGQILMTQKNVTNPNFSKLIQKITNQRALITEFLQSES